MARLTHSDRIKMEALLNAGHSVKEIANQLHVHQATIYREYNRGKYMHRNSDYTEEERYSSDLGQQAHDWYITGKGRPLKIKNDIKYIEKLEKKILDEILPKYPQLSKLDVQIIRPGEHDCYTNTMMDIIPISTKVLGKIGDGITHTLTGVYVILTGVDENGKQAHEFGSSEGNLKEKLYLNRAGTPGDDDYIVSFDVVLKPGMGQEREGVLAAHHACDEFIQIFREQMKKFRGDLCTERHEYHDVVRPGKKRVLIVKQVAGQGAMYDTSLFAKEPSGTEDGRSIIDMGNMPVIVTPNEYRDGIIRSMQ